MRGQILQRLWVLPVCALVSPPIVWVLVLLVRRPYADHLYTAYWVLGALSPVLGLATLATLAIRWLMTVEELPGRMSRRRVAVLAVWAVVAPVWLAVMLFAVLAFNR
jgi:hypothetical protein